MTENRPVRTVELEKPPVSEYTHVHVGTKAVTLNEPVHVRQKYALDANHVAIMPGDEVALEAALIATGHDDANVKKGHVRGGKGGRMYVRWETGETTSVPGYELVVLEGPQPLDYSEEGPPENYGIGRDIAVAASRGLSSVVGESPWTLYMRRNGSAAVVDPMGTVTTYPNAEAAIAVIRGAGQDFAMVDVLDGSGELERRVPVDRLTEGDEPEKYSEFQVGDRVRIEVNPHSIDKGAFGEVTAVLPGRGAGGIDLYMVRWTTSWGKTMAKPFAAENLWAGGAGYREKKKYARPGLKPGDFVRWDREVWELLRPHEKHEGIWYLKDLDGGNDIAATVPEWEFEWLGRANAFTEKRPTVTKFSGMWDEIEKRGKKYQEENREPIEEEAPPARTERRPPQA